MMYDWIQIVEDAPTMPGEYHKIDWIRTGELGLDNRNIVTYPYIQPVSLTPEILENNGWQWDGMYATLKYGGNKLLMWYKHEGILRDFYIHKNGEKELMFLSRPGMKYVHTLQHALKLCCVDKEIKL